MKKTVNYCGNCPFFTTQFDDFAIGDAFTYTCNLAQFQKNDEYFLTGENEVPEWCPLKKEECTFQFNKFSPERLKEIEDVITEIRELEDWFETEEYYHTDFKDAEYLEKDKRLNELYDKSSEMYSNEEVLFDIKEFQDEINKNVDEIKKQLLILEEAGFKLQESFLNLGKQQ